VAGLDLNHVGFLIVGVFVVVWAGAIAYWKLARVPQRWTPAVVQNTSRESSG
jgi:high-affinity nickel-transport protein